MINIFLFGYLMALMPSLIALAWFVWRASPFKQEGGGNESHQERVQRLKYRS